MVRSLAECENDYEKELVGRIQAGDWQVTSVFSKDNDPAFAYSIGIYESFRQPELLLIGINAQSAAKIVNRYGAYIQAEGREFESGHFYGGFLDDLDVYVAEATDLAKTEYTLSCRWFYKGVDFPLFQCVWPSAKGFWPWDAHAWADYKQSQPLFCSTPKT